MSLSSIAGAALTGLQAAQTGLRAVSDNVTNVDTVGYIRKVVDQQSNGVNGGVSTSTVRLVTDRFLQAASLSASAQGGQAGAISDLMDQAQSLFGDPSTDSSFFSSLDQVFAGFSTLSSGTATSASRAGALADVSSFFNNASQVSAGLTSLNAQADARITDDVGTVNNLLSQIDQLNGEISRATVGNGDATGAQNQQSQLIDQLSSLMDITVSPTTTGGVTVRASDGMVLAGGGSATLSYDASGPVGEISVTPPGGQPQSLGSRLTSGEIKGLLDLKNTELPNLSTQLSELTSQAATTINNVSNAYSAVPPPTTLTGRNTGLDLPTAVEGFTGKTTVAIVNSSGVIQQQVAIDFDAGTMTSGGTTTAFTPASFLSSLNTALSPAGSASFTNGALSISAASSTNGLAIADDATTPSQKTGRGFSAFFGLNDLVSSNTITNYDTGLQASDLSGFTGQIKLRLTDSSGSWLRDVTVTAPAGGTVGDLVNALNASSVSAYGSFSLDSNGQLSFAANPTSGVSLSVASDTTTRPPAGVSMSTLFGIGNSSRALRTSSFAVRSDITADPSKLPLAELDLTAAAGTSALAPGDTRGADALSQAGQTLVGFDPAGGSGATQQTLSDYASSLAGTVARKASAADQANTTAQAVVSEANTRRSSTEGVNLDQELVQLTTYQQAYSASARLIQAVKDMYDVLLSMTGT